MAVTICPTDTWTVIPDTGGAMLLEARGRGMYVSIGGTNPLNVADAISLASNASMVIDAALAVAVQPAQPSLHVRAWSSRV